MIRFCDGEVDILNIHEVTLTYLSNRYDTADNNVKLTLLYNLNGEMIGFISRDSYIHALEMKPEKIVNNAIVPIGVIAGRGMWKLACDIWEQYPYITFIPVFDKNQNIISLCYDDKIQGYQYLRWCYRYLTYEHPEEFIWNEEMREYDAVEIFDINEAAYYLYVILHQRGVKCKLHGNLWIYFEVEDNELDCLNTRVLRVFAEGTEQNIDLIQPSNPVMQFDFLAQFFYRTVRRKQIECRKNLRNYLTVRLPDESELVLSIAEEFRKIRDLKANPAPGETIARTYAERKTIEELCGMDPDEFVEKKRIDFGNFVNRYFAAMGNKYGFQISRGAHTIYLIGPCVVSSAYTLADHHIGILVDDYLRRNGISEYGVCCMTFDMKDPDDYQRTIDAIPLSNKDMIIDIGPNRSMRQQLGEQCDLDLTELFESRGTQEWFYDKPVHLNNAGNSVVAEAICKNLIIPYTKLIECVNEVSVMTGDVLSEKGKSEIDEYICKVKNKYSVSKADKKIGSIVMHANPFTKGHLYLVEKAASEVDELLVFVVEEDKSYFSFDDRFSMVCKGVAHLKNVKVIPSGKFIVSYNTLPTYFQKEIHKDAVLDASTDINLFARYICPGLGISIRYVGEEPKDLVTKQYNDQMKSTLPVYGVKVIEIQRKTNDDGELISASRVRKILLGEIKEDLNKYVPQTTYDYLKRGQ